MDNSINHNTKRPRDDSDDPETNHTQPESKLVRVNSSHSVACSPKSGSTVFDSTNSEVNSDESLTPQPVRVDPDELVMESEEVKLIQDDLLNILDDSDTVTDRDPVIQDLDSVIKSFEEQIQVPTFPEEDIQVPAFPVCEMTSSPGGSSQPELGYLLEASDDELGLPPTNGGSEDGKLKPDDFTSSGFGLDGMLGFENDIIPSYDSFEFGIGGDWNLNNNYNGGAEYVALGGLFDYSDGGVSDVSWRTESLSAL